MEQMLKLNRFEGGNRQELAIYVRELESQAQFYSMSGRWAHQIMSQPKFYVPGFVKPHELEEILPYLPDKGVTKDLQDKLQQFALSLPRNIGKKLLKKMNDFWAQAGDTYLAAASRLENAHNHLADPTRMKYSTLKEMTKVLLGPAVNEGRGYSNPDLYAVHRALLRSDIGFRVQPRGTLRAGGLYEILSHDEIKTVELVTRHVRSYVEDRTSRSMPVKGTLSRFIQKCQVLIDASRAHRKLTPYGTIGPCSQKSGPPRQVDSLDFTNSDLMFIKFIESWACLVNFNTASSSHGAASSILRSLERYDDALLDRKLGWTFLQEIGAIPPWESQAAYELRLSSVGRRLQRDSEETYTDNSCTADKLAGIRKDWGHLPVFCIDQVNAHEIDDGISIEATEEPDEYWAHIHVADPSSQLDPDTGAMMNAQSMMQSIYHPDRHVSMLNSSIVQSKWSLAAGRPCLTFSARMRLSGELLEHKISPGILRNVIYLEPSVFEGVASGSDESTGAIIGVSHVVGSGITSETSPSRKMTSINELSKKQKEQLKILHQVAMANAKKLQSRGGVNQGRANFDISVNFHGTEIEQLKTRQSVFHMADPTIKVFVPREKDQPIGALGYLMQLAGEVAARWCSARGIPIPYRVTPVNPEKQDPAEYFSKVLVPSRNEQGIAPMDITMKYFSLIGAAQPSLTPGPHMAVGAEMLTKCTSPLRRFPDLLVHAQIGATLLEEARLGKSLVGNKSNLTFLPYSAPRINDMLPQIDTRERSLKKAQRDAQRAWLHHFLIRAWHFKEAELPPTLTFSVKNIGTSKDLMSGSIEEFLAHAQCTIPDWLDVDSIKPDDKFEVEIADIDVYYGRIQLKPLRRIEAADE